MHACIKKKEKKKMLTHNCLINKISSERENEVDIGLI
jgi:hypothetical protein